MSMYMALSLFTIALGAILRYAVADHVSGVDLHEIGAILIILGLVGAVLAVAAEAMSRNRRVERIIEAPGQPAAREELRERH
jgi:hypothetical protein